MHAADPTPPLTLRLRQATRAQHTLAERSGLMRALLQGHLPLTGYVRLLHELLHIYRALEAGLQQHALHPQLSPVVLHGLFRSQALAADLAHWRSLLPVADTAPAGAASAAAPAPAGVHSPPGTLAGLAYVQHLQALARTQAPLLAAHAYVRYLGDLNGGQVLARRVAMGLNAGMGLAPDGASTGRTAGLLFYDFGGATQAAALAAQLRGGLDQLAQTEAQAQALVTEACAGFERHCLLFDELALPDSASVA